ncbi:DUF4136 domain-containing protein [Trinickia dinghuensis]|uniref:DUF4136 domain-containing protein n=1 Tax=Trinickia dinghuensis TaxID=2291023 RepID=A0A3D8JRW6_9BURK|nr:DUF4136 domain-containing protein [Trinickia dinghuensis]RDU95758.1 DUF4136 domain-containing protein [Trinickia dinghuensis]
MKWERVWRAVVPAITATTVLLSGCTTYVSTQVTAFSNWSGSDATRTYAFARTGPQQNSIEQTTYEQLVANELDTYAFRQVPSGSAHYLVGLSYSVRGDTVTVTQPVFYGNPWPGPFWRPIGPWGAFGPLPPDYVTQSYPVFTHTLGIRITERSSGKEVYNVTARNTDENSSLVRAMPYLVRSALADFPLGNGTVRTVRIRYEKGGAAPSNEVPAAPPGTGGPAAALGASAVPSQ